MPFNPTEAADQATARLTEIDELIKGHKDSITESKNAIQQLSEERLSVSRFANAAKPRTRTPRAAAASTAGPVAPPTGTTAATSTVKALDATVTTDAATTSTPNQAAAKGANPFRPEA